MSEQEKKDLANHRRNRTRRRNLIESELAKVENLESPAPVFSVDPNALLAVIATHNARINELNPLVAALIADEKEQNDDAEEAEEFSIKVDTAVALIQATLLKQQVAEKSMYGTPEAQRHVRFGPACSTPFPKVTGAGGLNFDATTLLAPTGILRQQQLPADQTAPVGVQQTAQQIFQPQLAYAHLPRELDISPEPFRGEKLKYRAFITQFRCFMTAHDTSQIPSRSAEGAGRGIGAS